MHYCSLLYIATYSQIFVHLWYIRDIYGNSSTSNMMIVLQFGERITTDV